MSQCLLPAAEQKLPFRNTRFREHHGSFHFRREGDGAATEASGVATEASIGRKKPLESRQKLQWLCRKLQCPDQKRKSTAGSLLDDPRSSRALPIRFFCGAVCFRAPMEASVAATEASVGTPSASFRQWMLPFSRQKETARALKLPDPDRRETSRHHLLPLRQHLLQLRLGLLLGRDVARDCDTFRGSRGVGGGLARKGGRA
jgi:hypothetical protein